MIYSEGVFVSSGAASSYIPPIADLRKLENAVHEVEKNSESADEYMKDLFFAGSSLGGARPKAYVQDVDGSMWMASTSIPL